MCMSPLETKPVSSRKLQKNLKIHASTGKDTSGSGLESTRGIRTWHRLERNPKSTLTTRKETGHS